MICGNCVGNQRVGDGGGEPVVSTLLSMLMPGLCPHPDLQHAMRYDVVW